MSPGNFAEQEGAGTAVIELADVSKTFGAVQALDGVSLTLAAGEVHCLAGENGAGKSTLIGVLTGAVGRDSGMYKLRGVEIDGASPGELRAAGVAAVYQELTVLPELSVEDNLLMGQFPTRLGILRRAERRTAAREMLERVGLDDVHPSTLVSELPVSARQLLEIAQVLGRKASAVIFDEPTTALSQADADVLLKHIRALRAAGVAVLYITHRLEEMFAIGDRVTVLKDGRVTQTGPIADLTHDSLITAMVGREIRDLYPARASSAGDVVLRAQNLRPSRSDAPVTIEVRRGEVVALAGLVGSGRTEVLNAIYGVEQGDVGTVEVDGQVIARRTPGRMKRAGVSMVPEDRKEAGLLLDLSVRENIAIASVSTMSRYGIVARRAERVAVEKQMNDVRVKAASGDARVTELSGGNQQKALFARCLLTSAKVLLLDEPTKGVDIGAKSEIYRLIGDLAHAGAGILLVSSYLPEVIGISDRIIVIRSGAVAGTLESHGVTEEAVLHLASPAPSSKRSLDQHDQHVLCH